MYKIHGKIQGIAPVLFNKPDEEALENPVPGKKNIDQKMAEMEARLHRDSDGAPIITKEAFKKSLLEGCRKAGIKQGRSSMSSFLDATIFLESDPKITGELFVHEHWGKIPPRTGAAVIIRRPAFQPGWLAPFLISVFDDARQPDAIKLSLDQAGLLVGIGSWRPQHGRFIVTEWEVEKT